MNGKDKYEATKTKIKSEVADESEKSDKQMIEAKNALEQVRSNAGLAAMYNENADAGAENLGGSLPTLSVYTIGKSKQLLANGRKPEDGTFYYAPLKTSYKTIRAHIMTISQGYKAPDMLGKEKFNQIVSGVFLNEGKPFPFMMFVRGLRLQNLWNFGKEAGQYTRMKPVSIPMFALTVEMTLQTKETDFGDNWIINFEILKDDTGFPVVITDEGEFMAMRGMVDEFKERADKIISAKATDEGESHPTPVESSTVSPDRIPDQEPDF